MMDSGACFLLPAKEMFENFKSKSDSEPDEADVVEKSPNNRYIRVLVRFPSGERKGRRFHCTLTIQSLYDYADSLGCLEVDSCTLVSSFPRVVYGPEKLSLSLKEAGLHPQASLFVEPNS